MSFFEKVGAFFGLGDKPPGELKLPAQQVTDIPINANAAKASFADLMNCWEEYRLRDLAFNCCVNLIAKAIANCEFKTFKGGQPVKEDFYYMFNVEPNVNENSTAFWQKVVYRLYKNNEALILATPRGNVPNLVVADSWTRPEYIPTQENVYRQIQVGEQNFTYDRKEKSSIWY